MTRDLGAIPAAPELEDPDLRVYSVFPRILDLPSLLAPFLEMSPLVD
jgi:hypothetical protein